MLKLSRKRGKSSVSQPTAESDGCETKKRRQSKISSFFSRNATSHQLHGASDPSPTKPTPILACPQEPDIGAKNNSSSHDVQDATDSSPPLGDLDPSLACIQKPDASPTASVDLSSKTDLSPVVVEPEKPLVSQYGRHVVKSIERSNDGRQLLLGLDSVARPKQPSQISLKGSWMQTDVRVGDVINLINLGPDPFVDDAHGLLVIEPDLLLSGTTIVSSLFCTRKAVLSERFKGMEEGSNQSMFVGTLLHMLLQECLRHQVTSEQLIMQQLQTILSYPLVQLDMLSLALTEQQVRQEVDPYLPHVLFFIDKYVKGRDVPVPEAAYSSSRTNAGQLNRPAPGQIWPGIVEAVKDIEENIWSPRLGMKGKVDLTVQVKLKNSDKKGRLCKVMPLELKTGRPSGSIEHRGQVIMYSMMMSERRPDPEAGLLLYLRTSLMQEVAAGIHEMRGLVQLRNQLARSLLDRQQLPDPINLRRACEKCPLLTVCAVSQVVTDSLPPAPHAMTELVPVAVSHLSKEHIDFFQKWSSLYALETGEALRSSRLKNLWCLTPNQRQAQGTAFADLVLRRSCARQASFYEHLFHKTASTPQSSLVNGSAVLVSDSSNLALAQGVLKAVDTSTVTVLLDRDLMGYAGADSNAKRFHLDLYDFQSHSGAGLTNLAKLISDNDVAKDLRDVVITRQVRATFIQGFPRQVATNAKHILRPLNRVQQKAIFKTLMAERFVLIKGMPGSGKTTAIVALIRLLVSMAKSVLICAYTHSAVDNVLLKLLPFQHELRMLRIGKTSRIHPSLMPFSIDKVQAQDCADLKNNLHRCQVVGATCLGVQHPAVTSRIFDFCILDEAGQSLLLASLGPLFYAHRFVLVGDPEQLPPVVQNLAARAGGMDISLFSHLQDHDNVIPLTVQYRMNTDIQKLANHLTYNGQLECASDEVANSCLVWKDGHLLSAVPSWIRTVMQPMVNMSVWFVDTSQLQCSQMSDANGIYNETECGIVVSILRAAAELCITRSGQNPSVGVMAPYRAQVALLRKSVAHIMNDPNSVNTVDQFQGKDRDLVIFSCTRTKIKSSDDSMDNILTDSRRLNVAITRAKSKLIMVGHQQCLLSFAPFQKLLQYLKDQDRICILQPNDL